MIASLVLFRDLRPAVSCLLFAMAMRGEGSHPFSTRWVFFDSSTWRLDFNARWDAKDGADRSRLLFVSKRHLLHRVIRSEERTVGCITHNSTEMAGRFAVFLILFGPSGSMASDASTHRPDLLHTIPLFRTVHGRVQDVFVDASPSPLRIRWMG